MSFIKLLSVATFSLCIVSGAHAQTAAAALKIDCESGNRSSDIGNCWRFPHTTYASGNAISGKYSATTEELTSTSVPNGAISPWIKFNNAGSIDLNMKLDSWAGAKSRKFVMLREDINNIGLMDTLYAYDFDEATAMAVQKPHVNIDFSGVKRLYFYFYGEQGKSKALYDDILIAGNNYASPSKNCTVMDPGKDSDGDGVPDEQDAFPKDPTRGYTFAYPADGPGTMMFEDTWPKTGDYDLNDLVVDYQYIASLNASNNIVDVTINYTTRAIGGVFHNGLMLQVDNLDPNYIESVTGSNTTGAKWVDMAKNGTENGQKFANILIYDDAFNVFPPQGEGIINTILKKPTLAPVTTSVVVTFTEKASKELTTKDLIFNPYLVLGQERGSELHMVDNLPTDKANTKMFGTGDDGTDPNKGIYYRTKNYLPFAISVIKSIPYMQESEDLIKGYPNIAEWAGSNGTTNNDWFIQSNRNSDVLYKN